MREGIHPAYHEVTITCSCGNSFITSSTLKKNLSVEICSACHPFYTGKHKLVDTAGRVDRFKQKYAKGAGAGSVATGITATADKNKGGQKDK